MVQVGIRELKAKLSAFLRRASAGETVQVTDRGRVVAELRAPPRAEGRSEAYQRLVAEGRIIPASEPRSRAWQQGLDEAPKLPKRAVGAALDDLRDDRF